MSRIPLNSLQTFIVAAQMHNLTHAAERMHLTVSALSHQIRLLEEQIDCTLFVRGPRGLKLTSEGQRLLDDIAPHLDAIAKALEPLRTCRDHSLSLSAMASMTSSWLLPRLPRFVAQYPEIELNLDSSAELVDFSDDRYDAALRYGMGFWPGLVVELLLEDWLTPVASPSLLADHKWTRDKGLDGLPLLGPEAPWTEWFASHGGHPPAHYVASFSEAESRQRAAIEGIGVTLGRTTMLRPLLKAGKLVALSPKLIKAEKAHYLVYPDRSLKLAGFRTFRQWLLDEATPVRPPS